MLEYPSSHFRSRSTTYFLYPTQPLPSLPHRRFYTVGYYLSSQPISSILPVMPRTWIVEYGNTHVFTAAGFERGSKTHEALRTIIRYTLMTEAKYPGSLEEYAACHCGGPTQNPFELHRTMRVTLLGHTGWETPNACMLYNIRNPQRFAAYAPIYGCGWKSIPITEAVPNAATRTTIDCVVSTSNDCIPGVPTC